MAAKPIKKNPGPLLTTLIKGTVDLIPPEFRAKIGLKVTTQENPVDVNPDATTEALIESRVEQTRTDERKKVNTELQGDLDTELVSKVKLDDGQTGILTRNLVGEGTNLPVDAKTERGEQRNLGNGKLDQTVVQRPLNLTKGSYEIQIPDPLPPEFGVLAPTSVIEEDAEGSPNTNPTLGTGDLSVRESFIDKWLKRVRRVTRAAVSVPKILTETRLVEGMLATVTKTYNNGIQTVTTAFLTLEAAVQNLGNNTSVRTVETVTAFPQRQGQDYDETLGVIAPYTLDRKVMGDDIGDDNKEIRPVDFARADVKAFDISALTDALEAYRLVFPGSTSIDLPDVLTSITSFVETQNAVGEANDVAGLSFWFDQGSWSNNPRSTAQSSVVAMPDVSPNITQKWARNVRVTHCLFFLKSPVTSSEVLSRVSAVTGLSVSAWPKFNPQTHTIFCIGGRASVQVDAHYFVHDGGGGDSAEEHAESFGTGESKELGLTIKAVRIPPTIHGSVGVSGFSSSTYTVSAAASTDQNSRDADAQVTARVTPLSFGATQGSTSIPTSGNYLLDTDAAPYKYGYARFHCVVLNAADL